MDHFCYRSGSLFAEGVGLEQLAREAGTPLYVYSRATFEAHLERFQRAFAPLDPQICFAAKSCPNLSILRLLSERGAGLDIVSGGELARALAAGARAGDCVFAGVGKSDQEIRDALVAGVGLFNCESAPEFENIAQQARSLGKRARVALRINPDVDVHAHRHTTTGIRATKFGVDIEDAPAFFDTYADTEGCSLCGLHLHIGSPIRTCEPFVTAINYALKLIDNLAARGHTIDTLDIGGGFAADYESGEALSAEDYARVIVPLLQERVMQGLRIIIEPGRSIAANAGVLLARVQYLKRAGNHRFAILDAGMHTLLRPSHYDAFHFIWPVTPPDGLVPLTRCERPALDGLEPCDVVGPICETGDFLALDRPLPVIARGDLLAVFGTGAYGMSMASRYNSFGLPPEVLVEGDSWRLIRSRETIDELFAHEKPFLQQPATAH